MSLFDLFRPKWKNSNPEKRKEAISEISDDLILMKIISNDSDENIKLCALEKITRDYDLMEIGLNNDSSFVKEKAISKISNPSTFIKFILNSSEVHISEIALNRVNSDNELRKIVSTCKLWPIKLKAFLRLNNIEYKVGWIEEINDEIFLADIVIYDEVNQNKWDAFAKISSDKNLEKVIKNINSSFWSMAQDALSKITDKSTKIRLQKIWDDKCIRGQFEADIWKGMLKELTFNKAFSKALAILKKEHGSEYSRMYKKLRNDEELRIKIEKTVKKTPKGFWEGEGMFRVKR